MSGLARALERSWYQRFGWSWLLLPLSALFWLLSGARRLLFRLGVLPQIRLPVPVVVVGNITVGGTGKTPITLRLCELLQAAGWKPGIISRGYGVQLTEPVLVSAASTASQVGDEPLLLAQLSGCPVAVYPDRVQAGQRLLEECGCDVLICDDGLQHYRLARDVEIVLIDGSRGLGNGCLLPAGPLREGRWRLQQADLVLANSRTCALTPFMFQLSPGSPFALAKSSPELAAHSAVHLVSGIGNPNRFASTVHQAGFTVLSEHWFADHHPFTDADLADLPTPLLMTEKDAVKVQPFAKPDWYCLPVRATLPAPVEHWIVQRFAALRSSDGN